MSSVNAICDDLEARTESVPDPETPEQLVALVRVMRDILVEANARMGALTPPAADREQLEAHFLSGNRQQEAVITAALPDFEMAVANGDEEKMRAFVEGPLAQVIALGEAQTAFLEAYGLTSCV